MVSASEGVTALPLRDLQTPRPTRACSPILKNRLALERQPTVASLSPAPVNAFRRVCDPLVVSCVRPGVCASAVHLSAEDCHPTLGFPRLPTVACFVACFDRAFLLVPAPTPTVFHVNLKGRSQGLPTSARCVRPARPQPRLSPPSRPALAFLYPCVSPCSPPSVFFFRACALFFFVKGTTRGLSGFFSSSLPTTERQTRNFVHFQWANLPFSHRYNSTFAVVVSICFCIARRQPVVLETAHHRHIWQFCGHALHYIRYAMLQFFHITLHVDHIKPVEYAPLRFGHHLGGGTPPGFCPVTWRFCA